MKEYLINNPLFQSTFKHYFKTLFYFKVPLVEKEG